MANSYFNFPLEEEPIKLKFELGDDIPILTEIEAFTFVFAYDYLSLEQGESILCFDNPNITKEAFIRIYKLKKRLSKISINDIQSKFKINDFHFHTVSWTKRLQKDTLSLLERFKKIIQSNKRIDFSELPDLYQIAVFTDNKNNEAPRIVGFFGKYSVFHVIWLDFEHQLYKSNEKYTK